MSVFALTSVVVTVLSVVQAPKPSPLPEPPPTKVTRQVEVKKNVVVTQKRLVVERVLVCPPFRRPYYVTQCRLVEEQVTTTITDIQTVTELVPWNGTTMNGTATINGLPELAGARIREVFLRTKELMVKKKMLPSVGDQDPRTNLNLPSKLELDKDIASITSGVFDSTSNSNLEYQIFVQFQVVENSKVSFRVDVRKRQKGSILEFDPADSKDTQIIFAEMFTGFPYKVEAN